MRLFSVLWCAALFAAAPLLHSAPGDAPAAALQLHTNDRIVILGNAAADALFQDGYLETLLHLRYPTHRLLFRNLAFPGDTAQGRGAPSAREQWLKAADPDVLLVFYGGAESFAAKPGLAPFRAELTALLKKAAAFERKGKPPLQVVVCGPMAVDPAQEARTALTLNTNRKLYSETAAAVAAEAGVPFIDLFSLTQELFTTSPQRSALVPARWGAPANALQTSAGYLTEEAHRLLAPKLFQALLGEPPPNLPSPQADAPSTDGPSLSLRAAVVARHAQWQARYRAAAGAPPPKDWPQLEPLFAKHNAAVWALASGETPVAEEKPAPPLSASTPASAGPGFKVQAGFAVQTFADSARFPELANPVQISWDSRGRLGVLCRPQPKEGPLPASADRLLLLEDTDGDGRADRCSVFADQLNKTGAFTFHRDGVLVEQAGDLWLLRDPNHTGKATERERVVMGFGVAGADPSPNRLLTDPRGAVYWADPGTHRSRVETGTALLPDMRGMVLRFEPASGTMEPLLSSGLDEAPGALLAQWGNVLFTDTKGQFWHFGPMVYGRPEPLPKQANWPRFWEKAPSPCTGTAIIRGGHFPPELHGALLASTHAKPAGIRHAFPREGSPAELLSSDDPAFRPRALAAAPDGSLFFADGGRQDGRIHRITAEDRPLPELPDLAKASLAELLDALKSPEESVREQARHRLGSLPAASTLDALKAWANRLAPGEPQFERHRLEALWTTRWFGALDVPLLEQVLASPEPQARAQAVRILAEARALLPDALRRLELMATDAHERVRLEVLAAAGSFAGTETPAAVRLVHRVLGAQLDATLERVAKETLRQLEPDPGRMLLPSDPGVLRFVLGRLSDAELTKATPAEPVWLAQLERAGIPPAVKQNALRPREKALHEFCHGTGPGPRPARRRFQSDTDRPPARFAGGAGTRRARPGREALQQAGLLRQTRASPQDRPCRMAPVGPAQGGVGAAPKRPSPPNRTAPEPAAGDRPLRPRRVPASARRAASPQCGRQRARFARRTRCAAYDGQQFSAQNLELLSGLLLKGKVVPEAVQALAQLPEETLRTAKLEPLLGALASWMNAQTGPARDTPAFAQAHQTASVLATAWEEHVRKTLEPIRKQTPPLLVVRPVCDQSRYDNTRLSVRAGQPFQLLFENTDIRPQNLVLTAPGEAANVLREAQQMPASPDPKGRLYVPQSSGVLAASRLLAPGEKETLQLKAPQKPGDYEYLSTAPGQPNAPRGVLC
jgi:glucose/arabinose dehydrogenase/lysophospholipase L1-like esterase